METVLLSIILSQGVFIQTKEAIFLAPFISAFLNDAFSCACLFFVRRTQQYKHKTTVIQALNTKEGKILILSGLFGGPLGMTAYLLAIKYIGVTYTAAISSLYPAIGAVIAWIFLKDKLSTRQFLGILLCAIGVIGMAGMPKDNVANHNFFIFAFACAFFWSLEAIISSFAMKKGNISYDVALQIRHGTSMICYAFLFLPLLNAWGFTLHVISNKSVLLLLLTAILETGSYLFYYKAIHIIGATKAMSLNITYMVWSVLFCILLFRQVPSGYASLSIIILLLGVLQVVYRKNQI
jgi:drug/metabolite transporter (DMT)-like permease